MRPFTLTTVSKLSPGDHYMIEGSEAVYTVLETPTMVKRVLYVRKGELKMTDMVNKNKTVIYIGKQVKDKK